MGFWQPVCPEKFQFFFRGKLAFSDDSTSEKKLFLEGTFLGSFWHCRIIEKFQYLSIDYIKHFSLETVPFQYLSLEYIKYFALETVRRLTPFPAC